MNVLQAHKEDEVSCDEVMKREGRHSLRIQVEGLKQQVTDMSKDLEDKTVLMQETEASLRSEVRLIIPGNKSHHSTDTTTSVKHNNSCSRVSRSLTKIEIGESTKVSAPQPVMVPQESTSIPAAATEAAAAAAPVVPQHQEEDKSSEEATTNSPDPSPLVRYKSLRDQEGKFSLVVKIR